MLSPAFSSFEYNYECYVSSAAESISLVAKTEDAAMKVSLADGKPLEKIPLNPGRTLVEMNVLSVNGKGTTKYSVVYIKPRLPITLQLKKKEDKFECAVCCGVLDKPSKIKGGPYQYCQPCLEELTRTNKVDPFTGKFLEEEGWMEKDYGTDAELGNATGMCPLPSGSIEAVIKVIGAKIKEERMKNSKDEVRNMSLLFYIVIIFFSLCSLQKVVKIAARKYHRLISLFTRSFYVMLRNHCCLLKKRLANT